MKFLSASQIRAADAFTIKHLPISSLDLMENAASLCTDWIYNNNNITDTTVYVYSGTGNNGGDGLVIARQLHLMRIKVECFVVGDASKGADDFKVNLTALEKVGLSPTYIKQASDLIAHPKASDVIVDALFGTGLSRPAEGLFASVIKHINRQPGPCIAIDLPSGLYAAKKQDTAAAIIKATHTLTFQCPKLNLVLPNYSEFVGDWHILDIGLLPAFIAEQESDYELIDKAQVTGKLLKRSKFSHKGTFGHALLVAGSTGKFGAAILAGKACLRSGIGLCTIHSASNGHDLLQLSCPEALFHSNIGADTIEQHDEYSFLNNKTIGIGPGIGLNEKVKQFFRDLLENQTAPMVLDADALTLLSTSPDLLELIPAGSILTPHPKEFERLFGEQKDDYDFIATQKKWSVQLNCVIILKGAHTRISTPEGNYFINQTGNSGMAKGGSGDVLTGILTALLGQGYEPTIAAVLGVYVHGLAGDLAAKEKGTIGMLPTDLIEQLPQAFSRLQDY